MNRKKIAEEYITHLENGNIEQLIALFNPNGIVDSPLYGLRKVREFYLELNRDTASSELHVKGIFEEDGSNMLALYFTYKWTLQNNQKVEFDVVDIIEFDDQNKIDHLKIIYDTVNARKFVAQLQK